MTSILTLTANPSLDLLFTADELVWEDANRLESPRRRPGGQGINVARAARELGGRAVAVAPLGGVVGEELVAMLRGEGTPIVAVPIAGETRLFVGARERRSGRSLLLNPRGPRLSAPEVERLLEAACSAVQKERPAWVCCCGSVPPGVPADLYARLGQAARRLGARFVPDCDGEPLRLAAESGCDLLVPNLHEAERLLGRRIDGVQDAAAAAAELGRFGAEWSVITLGGEGAVLARDGLVWYGEGPRLLDGSAVGAGDAFLAGLLLAVESGDPPDQVLRRAVAAGSAVLRSGGGAVLRREDAEALAPEVRLRSVR